MSGGNNFKMSQDYEIAQPKKKMAYPILVEEWDFLIGKIESISDDDNIYHTIGSIFLGVAGSAFIAALTLDLPSDDGYMPRQILISWYVFWASLICGVLSMFFGRKNKKINRTSAKDIVQQMRLIEKRYEQGSMD
ncbi:hypothetical protein AT359_24495 [Salmonella enterica subsp. enterica serovar Schwarzengrund]|nr:hypothetical protein [Salmonella enterica subsp. enterica serovar Heidelberg]ECY2974271.1 hypothetical protein [Salmonella enterica subsp. enterica serovar Schwarzengrund]EFH5076168.1 hypothetical protein [Escherichia coli]MDN0957746.1 hypothetical protein [Escherichia coli]